MSNPPLIPSVDSQPLDQLYKQFILETDRVDAVFSGLQGRFNAIQAQLQENRLKFDAKLAELQFISHYLDAILNHISQGLIFIDATGIITTWNPAASALLGKTQEEVLFHSFWEFFSDTFLGFSLKEALQTKTCPSSSFIALSQPDGRQIELEVETTFMEASAQAYPLDQRASSPPLVQGLLILIRNVTEVRRLQLLAHRHERLKEVGELAAMVAHEIRNPLGGIKGFASLLCQDLAPQPELQQMAASILEGVEGLNRFVTSILNYTRPFQPKLETINLVPFMQELIELIKMDKAFNSHVQCQVQASEPSIEALIDPFLLKSAVLNLLVNALQAMPNGGTLTIDLNQTGNEAIIQVKDTGVGIAPEHLQKIFSPLFTTKTSGNGFGLAEVHKVVQAHQGIIDVQSQVQVGTVFTIKLPKKILA